MDYLDIESLRQHCRIDADDNTQDAALCQYARAAHDYVLAITGYTEDQLYDTYGEMPPPLVQAMLLTAAHFYAYREAGQQSSVSSVPVAISYLIAPYRRLII